MKTRRTTTRPTLGKVRALKAALSKTARERKTEQNKAFLASIQRDFYAHLVQYLEEYVLIGARTAEQLEAAKQHYKIFLLKRETRLSIETAPFVNILFADRNTGARRTLRAFEPYPLTDEKRMRIAEEAKAKAAADFPDNKEKIQR